VATTRVARTQRAALEHVFYDTDGETPVAATGTVTVAVVDANGTAVTSGNATAAGTTYTFTLPAQSALGELLVTWTGTVDGTTVAEVDVAEVVGAHLFGLAEGRASDPTLADRTKYPTSALVAARLVVEVECEEICDRAFVPRYRRLVLDGTGTDELILADSEIRDVLAVRVAPRADGTFVALSADELAALVVAPDRTLRRVDGRSWTEGRGNVIVEYEHGWKAPPADLGRAMLRRFRSVLNLNKGGVPDRAQSYSTTDGTTYRLTLPEAYRTGIPFVDGIYARYSLRATGGGKDQGGGGAGTGGGTAPAPASRTLDYNPRRDSLFHGGVR